MGHTSRDIEENNAENDLNWLWGSIVSGVSEEKNFRMLPKDIP